MDKITPLEIAERETEAREQQLLCDHTMPLIKSYNGYKCAKCNKLLAKN